jgi:hypothetical protein
LTDLKSAREVPALLVRAPPLEAIDGSDNSLETVSNDDLLGPQRRIDLLIKLDNIGTRCARQFA